jgi:hypothetical protein
MTEPLNISFEVACAADHAFAIWTERIGTWWPADHTVSGAPEVVVLQGWVGGRIYEKTSNGEEHDWGVITSWRPPASLAYRWHLGAGPESATEVELTFLPLDDGTTRVEIRHWGWERIGEHGSELRSRNQVGWESLMPHFRVAVEKGA